MSRWLAYPLALFLVPICFALTKAAGETLYPLRSVPERSFYFFCGFFAYFLFQWIFFRPLRTYVFGHELTHAVAAWMSGAKVTRFKVGKKGGSVTVSKSNLFVALA